MGALEARSPEARRWWEENVSPMHLVFREECCEVVLDYEEHVAR